MFWFIVLLLFVGAGFYLYQKLVTIESEIRAEQDAELARVKAQENASDVEEKKPDTVKKPPAPAPVVKVAAAPVAVESETLESAVLAKVAAQPGMKQTELYASFAAGDKKKLQVLLKELGESGKLKREKKGNSYLLFPA